VLIDVPVATEGAGAVGVGSAGVGAGVVTVGGDESFCLISAPS
jgi:hypothetical protein